MKFLENGLDVYKEKLEASGKQILISGEYKGSKFKLDAECKVCSYKWSSLPYNLVRNGCPSCSKRVPWTIETLQKRLDDDSRDILITSTSYKNRQSKLDLFCKVCEHTWKTSAGSFLKKGCSKCAGNLKLTSEILQLRLDQSSRNIKIIGPYKNMLTNIECECTECGDAWECSPGNLLAGRSCLLCNPGAGGGFDPKKPAILYYLRVSETGCENYWKIGITNLTLKKRFCPKDREKITVLNTIYFEDGATAYQCEKNILRLYKEYKAYDVTPLRDGNTELFLKDVLQMDHLLEVTDGFS